MDNSNKVPTTATLSTQSSVFAASPPPDDRLRDIIYGLKLQGQQRPEGITQDHWDSVVIRGSTSVDFVTSTYREQLIKKAAESMLTGILDDPKSQITAMHALAVDQLVHVLTDPATKDGVRLQASTYIIDHNIGKAKQEIEHSGSLALEIRAQAKQAIQLAASMREVGEKEMVDKPLTVVDAFLEKHVKDDFIVGKKAVIDDEL